MVLQQSLCTIFTSVKRLSSSQGVCRISLYAKTISKPNNFIQRCVVAPDNNLNPLLRCRIYLHHDQGKYLISSAVFRRKFHTSSVFRNQTEVSCVVHDTVINTNTNSGSMEVNDTKNLYKSILASFPEGIQMAFAYGSGAIEQKTIKDKSRSVLDFILVVDDPHQWHHLNMQKHSKHYSFLKRFGADGLAKIQDNYGAGVYFNTLVPMHGRIIKYGVISTSKLITDLLDWESLYISGRLHKPISLIIMPKDEHLLEALVVNLQSAVHTALLLLPDTFTEEQLYLTIAGLSYSGDIRMSLAEDNNKVANIVTPNLWAFRRMYLPIIMKEEHVVYWQDGSQLEQSLTFESRHHHLTQLPCKVLQGLVYQKHEGGLFPDMEEIIVQRAFDSECGSHVSRSIRNIVKSSSAAQTWKGVFTAGFVKSVRYGMSKVLKKIKSV